MELCVFLSHAIITFKTFQFFKYDLFVHHPSPALPVYTRSTILVERCKVIMLTMVWVFTKLGCIGSPSISGIPHIVTSSTVNCNNWIWLLPTAYAHVLDPSFNLMNIAWSYHIPLHFFPYSLSSFS